MIAVIAEGWTETGAKLICSYPGEAMALMALIVGCAFGLSAVRMYRIATAHVTPAQRDYWCDVCGWCAGDHCFCDREAK